MANQSKKQQALSLLDQNRIPEAMACYREICQADQSDAEAWYQLAGVHGQLREFSKAETCCRQAISHRPDYAGAYYRLGNALDAQERFDEAIEAFETAIRLKPDYANAHNNLGLSLMARGQAPEAEASYRQALALQPSDAAIHTNLALALVEQNCLKEAETSFLDALELNPTCIETRWSLALLRLLTGNFKDGWPDYELRWQRTGKQPRSFKQPPWAGEDLTGRTLLLHAEQGYGDTLQFIRYAALVKARGASVIVECPQPLYRLLSTSPAIAQLVAEGDPLPAFDTHLPLASLPRLFHTDLGDIPHEVPYLFVPDGDFEGIKTVIAQHQADLNIGIVWAGKQNQVNLRKRTTTLDHFRPIAKLEGVALFSLLKGHKKEGDQKILNELKIIDLEPLLNDFADTAAAIMQMDLIITIDTSVTHLAGALGKPTWVLLPYSPDWRWLLDREDSPWYPSMRLVRQGSPGDWAGVFKLIIISIISILK